jgi:hypothetical protein
MKESVTYQAIVEERVLRARLEDLLQLGQRQFGTPSIDTETALRGIANPDRLARMIGRLLDVSSWEQLLATP